MKRMKTNKYRRRSLLFYNMNIDQNNTHKKEDKVANENNFFRPNDELLSFYSCEKEKAEKNEKFIMRTTNYQRKKNLYVPHKNYKMEIKMK